MKDDIHTFNAVYTDNVTHNYSVWTLDLILIKPEVSEVKERGEFH